MAAGSGSGIWGLASVLPPFRVTYNNCPASEGETHIIVLQVLRTSKVLVDSYSSSERQCVWAVRPRWDSPERGRRANHQRGVFFLFWFWVWPLPIPYEYTPRISIDRGRFKARLQIGHLSGKVAKFATQ